MVDQNDNRSSKNKDAGIITREDLSLFMETYRNMIESNLQLMDKQDKSIDILSTLSKSIDNINQILSNGFKSTEEKHNGFAIKLFGVIGVLCTIILGMVGLMVAK